MEGCPAGAGWFFEDKDRRRQMFPTVFIIGSCEIVVNGCGELGHDKRMNEQTVNNGRLFVPFVGWGLAPTGLFIPNRSESGSSAGASPHMH